MYLRIKYLAWEVIMCFQKFAPLLCMFANMLFSIGYRLPAREPDSAQGHQGPQHLPHGRHEGGTFPLGARAGPRPTSVWRARFFCTYTGYTRTTKGTTIISASKVFGALTLSASNCKEKNSALCMCY
jgi:hypothetical protein